MSKKLGIMRLIPKSERVKVKKKPDDNNSHVQRGESQPGVPSKINWQHSRQNHLVYKNATII